MSTVTTTAFSDIRNGNSKFLNGERNANTTAYLNGGDKIVVDKPPLKSRANGISIMSNKNTKRHAASSNVKEKAAAAEKSFSNNDVTPAKTTTSEKKKIFTKGTNL